VLVLALGLACSSPPSEPPPDPCPAIFHDYEAARVDACRTDDECVHVSGIQRVSRSEESVMGAEPPRPPCGAATRRGSEEAVESAVERYRAAACGPIGRPGSGACMGFTHGPDPRCAEGHCLFPW